MHVNQKASHTSKIVVKRGEQNHQKGAKVLAGIQQMRSLWETKPSRGRCQLHEDHRKTKTKQTRKVSGRQHRDTNYRSCLSILLEALQKSPQIWDKGKTWACVLIHILAISTALLHPVTGRKIAYHVLGILQGHHHAAIQPKRPQSRKTWYVYKTNWTNKRGACTWVETYAIACKLQNRVCEGQDTWRREDTHLVS